MKMVGLEQSHQLMSVLSNNTDWSGVSSETAQRIIDDPTGSGQEFTRFLINSGRVVMVQSSVITIPRATPFNPAEFIGQGWSIWKGPADGDGLSGDEDQDERSLALTELDLSKIQLLTQLKKGEKYIVGEEILKRLKATDHTRLDAGIFLAFWQNQHLIPKRWKEKTGDNTTFIHFPGTILRSPYGYRGVLCLYWGFGGWDWSCDWFGSHWDTYSPLAVLAS